MSTMTEAVEHVLARRELAEKVAAAREEQREACADEVYSCVYEDTLTELAAAVRSTPLDATPLADRIAELERHLSDAKLDREKASAYAIALQRICETMRRVTCGEDAGFLHVPDAFKAAPFYATMVPLVVEAAADLRAAAESAANVTKTLAEERDYARNEAQRFARAGDLAIAKADAAEAELAAERALSAATQASVESRDAAYAARVAELTAALTESRDAIHFRCRGTSVVGAIAGGAWCDALCRRLTAALSAASEAHDPNLCHAEPCPLCPEEAP